MLVIDASIAVKALTNEAGSEKAATIIAGAGETFVPDFIKFEVASALAKKVRLAGLPSEQARAALDALPLILPDHADTVGLIQPAMALSVEMNHALFDCLYLALAVAHGCKLVTSDEKFIASARASAYRSVVITMDEAVFELGV